ncbi:MAG: META domain-containing protein [Crocinitomicaceae bacterium]
MKFSVIAIFTISSLILSCGSTKPTARTESVEDNKNQHSENMTEKVVDREYSNDDTLLIWVGSQLDTLASGANQLGLRTQEGVKYPAIEGWECVHERINGFIFEPGYTCLLKVKVEQVEGKPQLRMVELVSKMMDMDYYRVNDIWALTHMNGEVLDISTQRPNMEINLKIMRVMGSGSCNNYMGKIETYNSSAIRFGALAGTKMMCQNIKTEDAFYAAMANTRKYEVKNMTLLFYDETGVEILRFQKVD